MRLRVDWGLISFTPPTGPILLFSCHLCSFSRFWIFFIILTTFFGILLQVGRTRWAKKLNCKYSLVETMGSATPLSSIHGGLKFQFFLFSSFNESQGKGVLYIGIFWLINSLGSWLSLKNALSLPVARKLTLLPKKLGFIFCPNFQLQDP